MKTPTQVQLAVARRLLAHEANESDSAEARAAAAVHIHDKVFARLASLLGAGGACALYARSVKATAIDVPSLRSVDLDTKPNGSSVEPLLAFLREATPAVATESATAICTSLLVLLTTLSGERLTFQILRSAWPTFDASAPNEETNR